MIERRARGGAALYAASIMTTSTPPRRRWLAATAGALLAPLPLRAAAPPAPRVQVWKDPSCGCCGDWVQHLQRNGYAVTVRATGNTAMRARLGIASAYASCHTAVVDGYVLEGHVPVREIGRLLAERPGALGLAVPGMPVGSPGMDGAVYQGRRDRYEVLLLLKDGGARPFQRYG